MNFNKNTNQIIFNKIKGVITEINIKEKFSNITLNVGQSNKRHCNFVSKTEKFTDQIKGLKVNDNVCINYYWSSNLKNGRWYSTATIITIE